MTGHTYRIPFLDAHLLLYVGADSLPYVPIQRLCSFLWIDYDTQVKRVKRHSTKNGLKVIDTEHGVAMPAMEVSWFLRTLRPSVKKAQEALLESRDLLPLIIIHYWSRQYNKPFMAPRDFKAVLLNGSLNPDHRENGRKNGMKSRVTSQTLDQMRKMVAEGRSQADVARELRFSPATVSLCLNGKYPVRID